jgi:uncharacterized cupredoxin-like copper-binding protein
MRITGISRRASRVIPRSPRASSTSRCSREAGRWVYEPAGIEVRRGEQIRFVLQNDGEEDHEFILATVAENRKHAEVMKKNPDMEHDDPNAKRLLPHGHGEIVWRFTKRGTFEFACLIPGHYEKGMVGQILVK